MTIPGGYSSTFGRGGQPPYEDAALATIAAARSSLEPPRALPARPLTEQEKAEAQQEAAQAICPLCIAIHPMPGSPGCPRLATFEVDGDGKVVKGSFRADTAWHARVVLAEDIHEDGEEAGDDDK